MAFKLDNLTSTVTLTNGVPMPVFGLGVFKSEPGAETENAVNAAVELGYQHIDTAAYYQNEADVGRGVAGTGAGTGNGVFVTTKVWNSDQGYDNTLRALDRSLEELNLPAVDLYLVHWPKPEHMKDTWRAMERIYDQKLARAIGVSNFEPHHLEELSVHGNHAPTVNQVELHPYLTQQAVRDYCRKHRIVVEAWSPLGRGKVIGDAVLKEIGQAHNRSEVHVALRWALQHDIVVIPKSVNRDRIADNTRVFDFTLSEDEMARIDALNVGEEGRIGPHPDTISF